MQRREYVPSPHCGKNRTREQRAKENQLDGPQKQTITFADVDAIRTISIFTNAQLQAYWQFRRVGRPASSIKSPMGPADRLPVSARVRRLRAELGLAELSLVGR